MSLLDRLRDTLEPVQETKNPITEQKNNNEPPNLLNNLRQSLSNTSAMMQIGYSPSGTITPVGTEIGKSKYDYSIPEREIDNLGLIRASRQSGGAQALNATFRGLGSAVMTAVEDVSYILDFDNNINRLRGLQEVESNWLADIMKSGKDYLREKLPVYRKRPDQTFDFSDPGFYWDSWAGILDSGVGFGLVGMGTGAFVKGAGALLKLGIRANKVNRLKAYTDIMATSLQEGRLGNLSAAFITNYGEGKLMALETYEEVYNARLQDMVSQYQRENNGAEPDEATLNRFAKTASGLAGEAADNFQLLNMGTMFTDYLQLNSIFKGATRASRNMLPKPSMRNFWKDQSNTAPKEYFEEVGQNVLQMEMQFQSEQTARAQGIQVEDPTSVNQSLFGRIVDFATSEQAQLEGLMGLSGGPVQYAITTAPFQNNEQKLKQYNIQEQVKLKNKEYLENKLNIVANQTKAIQEALEKGEVEVAQVLQLQSFDNLAIENFTRGTTENLEAQLQEALQSPDYTDTEKESVKQKLERLTELEQRFNTYQKYANSEGIMSNRLSNDHLKDTLKLLDTKREQYINSLTERFSPIVERYNENNPDEQITIAQLINAIQQESEVSIGTEKDTFNIDMKLSSLPGKFRNGWLSSIKRSEDAKELAMYKFNKNNLYDAIEANERTFTDMQDTNYQLGYQRLKDIVMNPRLDIETQIESLNKLEKDIKPNNFDNKKEKEFKRLQDNWKKENNKSTIPSDVLKKLELEANEIAGLNNTLFDNISKQKATLEEMLRGAKEQSEKATATTPEDQAVAAKVNNAKDFTALTADVPSEEQAAFEAIAGLDQLQDSEEELDEETRGIINAFRNKKFQDAVMATDEDTRQAEFAVMEKSDREILDILKGIDQEEFQQTIEQGKQISDEELEQLNAEYKAFRESQEQLGQEELQALAEAKQQDIGIPEGLTAADLERETESLSPEEIESFNKDKQDLETKIEQIAQRGAKGNATAEDRKFVEDNPSLKDRINQRALQIRQQIKAANEILSVTTPKSEVDAYPEVQGSFDTKTNEVINDKKKSTGEQEVDKEGQQHVKLVTKGASATAAFIEWQSNGVNPAGTQVTYSVVESYNKYEKNKTALRLLDEAKKGKILTEEEKLAIVHGLPIRVSINGVNNAHTMMYIPTPENKGDGYEAEKNLRLNIINNLIAGKPAVGTITGQYGGDLVIGDTDVSIKNIPDFKNKESKDIQIHFVDGEGKIRQVGTKDILYGGTTVMVTLPDKRKVPMTGAIFTTVQKANGDNFPLKLNVKPYTDKDLDLIYKLFQDLITIKDVKGVNLLETPVPKYILDLMNAADFNFLTNNSTKVPKYKEVLKYMVYENAAQTDEAGQLISGNPVTQLYFKNGQVTFGGMTIGRSKFPQNANNFKKFLQKYKSRNIDLNRLATDNAYKSHIIDSGYLTTNADTTTGANTMFEAADGSANQGLDRYRTAAIYVDTKLTEQAEVPTAQVAVQPEVKPEVSDYSTFTNYSGAAAGADTAWETIGKEFGLGKQVNYTPSDLTKLTPEQKQEVENAYQQAVIDLGRKALAANTYSGGLVRRDYLQAKAADAVFAISTIVQPGQKDSKGYTNKTNRPLVAGGTGYAVQMAINLGKPVFVFDQNQNQWFTWNGATFTKTTTPTLTQKFAGIGTREINENGKQAIRNVFQQGLSKKSSLKTQVLDSTPERTNLQNNLSQQAEQVIMDTIKNDIPVTDTPTVETKINLANQDKDLNDMMNMITGQVNKSAKKLPKTDCD